MMNQNEKNFYFQGKYFDTVKEMFDYCVKWGDEPLDQETATRLLKTVTKDIVLNKLKTKK